VSAKRFGDRPAAQSWSGPSLAHPTAAALVTMPTAMDPSLGGDTASVTIPEAPSKLGTSPQPALAAPTTTTTVVSRAPSVLQFAWRPRATMLSRIALAFFVLITSLAPRLADAQALQRLAWRGEIGPALMLGSAQQQALRQMGAIHGGGRFAVTIYDPFAIQLGFTTQYFPNDLRPAQQYVFSLGPRFEPRIAQLGRLFIDANLGVGTTPGFWRFALEAGAGFEFQIAGPLSLGPYVRYTHMFAAASDAPSDSQVIGAGLTVALRMPSNREPGMGPPTPTDHDGDGVLDSVDLCPTEPVGRHADPGRPGCPARDSDHDGLLDTIDQCPLIAVGSNPDPTRPGCPALDSDGDGIIDPIDRCPTSPPGANPDPSRPGCPDGDDDNDRVPNRLDRCPAQHQGIRPDPVRPGCPQPDRDNDNVPDAQDACPNEAGAPNPRPRRNGCPGLLRVESEQIRILQPVFFASRSDRILPRSWGVLRAVSDAMRAMPEIRRLSIDGHTDDVGPDDQNLVLSQRRANNLMAFMIQNGIEPARLEAHGFGETRPLINDTTAQVRATNRRVEFRITDIGTPGAGGNDAPRH